MPRYKPGAVQLHPLNMRISGPQFEALQKLRTRTGLPLMEHVRRAIDLYLSAMEKKRA